MKKRYLSLFCGCLFLSLLFVVSGCVDNIDPLPAGGHCEYAEIPGTATIISMGPPTGAVANCGNDPVEVRFDFTPNDANARDAYRCPHSSDNNRQLLVGEGKNPPRSYMESKGITVGSTHKCIRMEITEGTCTPVLFEFSKIDLSDYGDYCR